MKEQVREILRRYGNFMSGSDDGDAIDIDEATQAIVQLVEAPVIIASGDWPVYYPGLVPPEDWPEPHDYGLDTITGGFSKACMS